MTHVYHFCSHQQTSTFFYNIFSVFVTSSFSPITIQDMKHFPTLLQNFHALMAETEVQTYVKLFFIWLLFTVVVRAIRRYTRSHPRRPPVPPSLPVIGHLHLISALPHQSFHALATRHGPIMQIFLGSVSCVVVSSPELAKEFLKAHERSFSNRFVSAAVHQLSYGSKGFLFARYGRFWKFMKKICMSELLGSRTLDQFLHVREQETRRSITLLYQTITFYNSPYSSISIYDAPKIILNSLN